MRASHSHCGGQLALPKLSIILPECKFCHRFACRDPSGLHTADLQSQDVTLPFTSLGKFSLATFEDECVISMSNWNVTEYYNIVQIRCIFLVDLPLSRCYYKVFIALTTKSGSCCKPAPWRLIPTHLKWVSSVVVTHEQQQSCVISMDNIVIFLVPEFRLLNSVFRYINIDVILRGIRSLQILLISFQVLHGQYLFTCGETNSVA